MGISFKQVRDVDKTVKKIVARVCREMDAENAGYREYWKIACTVAADPEMLELVEDPTNYEALIAAYVDSLVWDAACGTGDRIDVDDSDDPKETTALAESS